MHVKELRTLCASSGREVRSILRTGVIERLVPPDDRDLKGDKLTVSARAAPPSRVGAPEYAKGVVARYTLEPVGKLAAVALDAYDGRPSSGRAASSSTRSVAKRRLRSRALARSGTDRQYDNARTECGANAEAATMTGRRNVLIAEPMRLTAITKPIPEAGKSVEKSSGTNTNTRSRPRTAHGEHREQSNHGYRGDVGRDRQDEHCR